MKKIFLILILVLLVVTGCGKKDTSSGKVDGISYKETDKKTNYVKIDTSQGIIIAELYPGIAPITVDNFKELVANHFYDGLIFHRVIKGFMIQGGGYSETKAKPSNKKIKGEFVNNGISNSISHVRGVLSMGRAQSYDSASAQFFIVHEDSTYLDGNYAGFGKVIAGMSAVDKIAETETDDNDWPLEVQKINSIRFVEIKE